MDFQNSLREYSHCVLRRKILNYLHMQTTVSWFFLFVLFCQKTPYTFLTAVTCEPVKLVCITMKCLTNDVYNLECYLCCRKVSSLYICFQCDMCATQPPLAFFGYFLSVQTRGRHHFPHLHFLHGPLREIFFPE